MKTTMKSTKREGVHWGSKKTALLAMMTTLKSTLEERRRMCPGTGPHLGVGITATLLRLEGGKHILWTAECTITVASWTVKCGRCATSSPCRSPQTPQSHKCYLRAELHTADTCLLLATKRQPNTSTQSARMICTATLPAVAPPPPPVRATGLPMRTFPFSFIRCITCCSIRKLLLIIATS